MSKKLNEMVKSLAVNSLANSFSVIDKVQHMFDDFDVETFGTDLIRHRDNMVRQGNAWLSDLGDFFKQVKETVTAFTVTVPFDPEKEQIDINVEDGVLKVQTSFNDDTTERKTFNTVTIPEDCDVDRMSHKVNAEKKTMVIIIPKKAKDGDTVSERINKIVEEARAKAAEKAAAKEAEAVKVEEPKAEPVNATKKVKKPVKPKAKAKTKKS